MDLFDSKRQERLEAARKASVAAKKRQENSSLRQEFCCLTEKSHHICDRNMDESLYSRRSNLVIGFHGCDKTIVDAVVAGKTDLLPRGINQDYPNP